VERAEAPLRVSAAWPAGQRSAQAAEAEYGQSDEDVRVVESECHPGDQSQVRIHARHECVRQIVINADVDSLTVFDNPPGQVDERRDAAALGP
jgi:hypothetical protein